MAAVSGALRKHVKVTNSRKEPHLVTNARGKQAAHGRAGLDSWVRGTKDSLLSNPMCRTPAYLQGTSWTMTDCLGVQRQAGKRPSTTSATLTQPHSSRPALSTPLSPALHSAPHSVPSCPQHPTQLLPSAPHSAPTLPSAPHLVLLCSQHWETEAPGEREELPPCGADNPVSGQVVNKLAISVQTVAISVKQRKYRGKRK